MQGGWVLANTTYFIIMALNPNFQWKRKLDHIPEF